MAAWSTAPSRVNSVTGAWNKASEIRSGFILFLFAKGAGGPRTRAFGISEEAIQVFQIYNLGMATKGSMDHAAWRLFIDAVELGSLSKVAAAYGIGQPHVSRKIGELERECGGRLFQRTGRGVVLTDSGSAWRRRCDRGWRAPQLANNIKATSGKPIGRV